MAISVCLMARYPCVPATKRPMEVPSSGAGLSEGPASQSPRTVPADPPKTSATVLRGSVPGGIPHSIGMASGSTNGCLQTGGKVCVLLSSESQFSRTSETGEEFVAEAGVSLFSLLSMHRAARSCGYTLEFVTPSGEPPPVASFSSLEEVRLLLLKEKEEGSDFLIQRLQQTQVLRKAAATDYCCLLLPHHLGAAVDLYNSSNTGALIRAFGAKGKPVGVVGYGGFALCAKPLSGRAEDVVFKEVLRANGWSELGLSSSGCERFPFAGCTMATVPLAEEARHPYFGFLPFHLELHFATKGARLTGSPKGKWGLTVDGNLVSAAGEASTELVLRTLLLLSSMEQQQE
ncbi:uncharacterized protein LOC34620820 [Cyclospora cayetanensis]|uniref:Uncharacterized protein LOC34620820 n=1 Tax=Cyclospora cayetanensis TaxID=88456 RepID=A0A6P6RX81_9EIME|nr:uncharacterized protein LOC34620820 [Cyclospora cayetanensis]